MRKLGIPPENLQPGRYTGPRFNLVPCVEAKRRPLTLDRDYSLLTLWRVDFNPSSGSEGEVWQLIKFDTNGDAIWVRLEGTTAAAPLSTVTVNTVTGPGVNPVEPDGAGDMDILATTVAAHSVPVETHSRGLNAFNIEIQVASDRTGAPANMMEAGLCSFDDNSFVVDANGYVTLAGGGGSPVDGVIVDANTPPGTATVLADGAGDITVSGAAVAPHSVPVEIHSRAANAYNVEIQAASAVTGDPGTTVAAGLAQFDDTVFAVTTEGYVTFAGGVGVAFDSITVDDNTGPGTNPVLSNAGVLNVTGAAVAAHSIPLEIHSRAANSYNVEVQVATTRSGAPGNTNDAGISSYDTNEFGIDVNGFVTVDEKTRMTPGYVENLGINYDGGTGIFSIQGATAALSTTNPAYIVLQSQAAPGELVLYKLTADQSFIDDVGASEIINNLFGHTTGRIVDQDIPFFIYAVPNDAEDTVQFMISRVPHKTTSPVAASIGAPDDAVADAQSDFWSIDSIDETLYESNPCLCIGGFRMRMSTLDDWTVQTLDPTIDGIGMFFESHYFTQVKGHYSADAASYFVAGGSTVPAWNVENLTYTIQRTGTCNWAVAFSGDGGTDGAGGAAVQIASPFYGPNIDFSVALLSSTTGGAVFAITGVHTAANRRLIIIRESGTYLYSTFGNGARQITFDEHFKILDL